ncbi:hypothetical protein PoB_005903500 [Plakobranchus ocellatus]|uniref:Uncharacterized protein n=1 Tax=Plakobranchus ocellatus TaxID=259542 RepID=A0AAV4CI57_9GAST|nr:hypothetical protein PoB_005903500 [Plakobranchus ocellatus]
MKIHAAEVRKMYLNILPFSLKPVKTNQNLLFETSYVAVSYKSLPGSSAVYGAVTYNNLPGSSAVHEAVPFNSLPGSSSLHGAVTCNSLPRSSAVLRHHSRLCFFHVKGLH